MLTDCDDPGDYSAVMRLLGQTRTWQAATDPRLNITVDARIVSHTVVTHPWRNDPREAYADAEGPHTADGEQYRRATELLATFVAIWSDGRAHDADVVRGILIYILFKVRRGHDRPDPIAQDEWDWGTAEAGKLIAAAQAAVQTRGQQDPAHPGRPGKVTNIFPHPDDRDAQSRQVRLVVAYDDGGQGQPFATHPHPLEAA
jgi:hypothetical protein